ncbi:MAG: flagellar hook-basal body complex protein FliE [Desulfovibrionaceae bacterium]|jgi:flagellar hook-basal body complex protein FliE|nr:flagellar hook-basal body complex protein FliE [Desulfovibrionaceae bacterium]
MAITPVAMRAYSNAMDMAALQRRQQRTATAKVATADLSVDKPVAKDFGSMVSDSIKKVNDMETDKKTSIQAFASGEEQNVHELMITLQKAGLAMSMTSAVRNKVMEAYKEVMHLQF